MAALEGQAEQVLFPRCRDKNLARVFVGEQHKPVAEGVEHPDALHHLLARVMEG